MHTINDLRKKYPCCDWIHYGMNNWLIYKQKKIVKSDAE